MGKTKVFVGNLSFKTTEKDLADEFAAAGKVASASIISRGARSLGYGFVEMESEEEAQKSVELLNKKLIDSREINVEIARPQKPPQENNNAPAAGGNAPAAGATGASTRGRRSFRGRRPRRGGKTEGGAAPADGSAPAAAAPAGNNNAAAPRQKRAPRPPRNDADKAPRTPSKDTLFVTNLPFSVDDAGLASIFQGLNIKSAHVVRKHNERSKGFGFVEFNNSDDQQKALTQVDKKNVEGRELVVKVALTEAARAAGAPGSPAPAAAATPAATPAAETKQ